jgi:hypothetical protein
MGRVRKHEGRAAFQGLRVLRVIAGVFYLYTKSILASIPSTNQPKMLFISG